MIARGASGGSGSEGQGWSLGAEARTVLELTNGDVLYFLVGQEGTSTCRKVSHAWPRPRAVAIPTSPCNKVWSILEPT